MTIFFYLNKFPLDLVTDAYISLKAVFNDVFTNNSAARHVLLGAVGIVLTCKRCALSIASRFRSSSGHHSVENGNVNNRSF